MRFLILHAVSIGLIPLGWLLARALAGDITGSDRYGNHYEHAAPAFWVTTSLFVILQAVLSYIRTHKVTLNAFGYFFSHLAIAMLTTGWFMAAIKIGPPPIRSLLVSAYYRFSIFLPYISLHCETIIAQDDCK